MSDNNTSDNDNIITNNYTDSDHRNTALYNPVVKFSCATIIFLLQPDFLVLCFLLGNQISKHFDVMVDWYR